jgi:hypothetical protein
MRSSGGEDRSYIPPSWWGLWLSSSRHFPWIASL